MKYLFFYCQLLLLPLVAHHRHVRQRMLRMLIRLLWLT